MIFGLRPLDPASVTCGTVPTICARGRSAANVTRGAAPCSRTIRLIVVIVVVLVIGLPLRIHAPRARSPIDHLLSGVADRCAILVAEHAISGTKLIEARVIDLERINEPRAVAVLQK
jgi:hypothetical protein